MVSQRRERMTGEQLARELVDDAQLHTIIASDTVESVRALDDAARRISERLHDHITTSQIRNIFGAVRMIEQDTKGLHPDDALPMAVQRALMMLRPKLAYQYGRTSGREDKKASMGALTIILSNAITVVLDTGNQTAFRNFVDFFEAILAYHRYYGGSTN